MWYFIKLDRCFLLQSLRSTLTLFRMYVWWLFVEKFRNIQREVPYNRLTVYPNRSVSYLRFPVADVVLHAPLNIFIFLLFEKINENCFKGSFSSIQDKKWKNLLLLQNTTYSIYVRIWMPISWLPATITFLQPATKKFFFCPHDLNIRPNIIIIRHKLSGVQVIT